MKNKILFLIFFLFFHTNAQWRYKDFDVSMGKGTKYYRILMRKERCLYGKHVYCQSSLKELYNLFKNMFDVNNLSVKKVKPRTSIPKIIHQIWVGGPLPEKYKLLQYTWMKMHPDWEYKLWTDEDAKTFDMRNREFYAKATNYGEKADIFRYEILQKYGGLYVDIDFECLAPFDDLNENYEFYTGVGNVDQKYLSVKNGLIASIPDHPILEHCIENIKESAKLHKVVMRTGPIHFTKSFIYGVQNLVNKYEYQHIIALPASYFYPIGVKERNMRGQELEEKLKKYPEAYGIHYWDSNWLEGREQIIGYDSEKPRIE